MWIPVLIIALVAAMAIGPLMWFRSTPSQRRVVAFRRRAAQQQLRVQLVSAEDLGLGLSELKGENLPGYGLPWSRGGAEESVRRQIRGHPWRLLRQRISHEGHFDGWWDWQPGLEADPVWHPVLHELLPELPADSVALENTRQGLWLYWQERGPLEQVDRVAELLHGLKEQARSF